jgi:DNA-binding transcriptional LysR family regulator
MAMSVNWDRRIGNRLRLRDLHIFFAVIETRGMVKAAARLGVTQPSVSRAIRDLEATLGVRLLDRSAQGVIPTIFGDALVRCGYVAFDELRRGIKEIECLADPASGEVRIGCLGSTTSSAIFTKTVERFAIDNPSVVLHVRDFYSYDSVMSGLRGREYDFAIGRFRKISGRGLDDIIARSLCSDQMVVLAGKSSKWATRRKIELSELADERWIFPEVNSWLYSRLAECFRAKKVPLPSARIVTHSVPLRAQLLVSGEFVAPVAASTLPLLLGSGGALKVLPIDLPKRSWPITIATLRNIAVIPVVEKFIQTAIKMGQ